MIAAMILINFRKVTARTNGMAAGCEDSGDTGWKKTTKTMTTKKKTKKKTKHETREPYHTDPVFFCR